MNMYIFIYTHTNKHTQRLDKAKAGKGIIQVPYIYMSIRD